MEREREAIEMNAPEARELLSLYYQVKGLPEEDADHVVDHLAQDKEQFLRALAAERFNTSRRRPAQANGLRFLGGPLDRRRRIHPCHSLFLSARIPSHHRLGHRLARRAFRRRSGQVAHHRTLLVGQRAGDDAVGAVEGIVTYIIGIGLGRAGA